MSPDALVAALSPRRPLILGEVESVVFAASFAEVAPLLGEFLSVDEFACTDRSCAPPPVGTGGSRPSGSGGQRRGISVRPVARGSATKTGPGTERFTNTKSMERDSIPDKFWNGGMVTSAIKGRHATSEQVKTGDDLVRLYRGNINALYEAIGLFGNDIVKRLVAQATNWYPAAGEIAQTRAEKYGISRDASAAVLATLSPGHDWDSNISEHDIALSVWKRNDVVQSAVIGPILKDILLNQVANSKTDRERASKQKKVDEVDDLLARVDGKRFNDLSLEDRARILKAHAAATGHDFSMGKWEVDAAGNPVMNGFRYNLDGSVKKIAFQQEDAWIKAFKILDAEAAGNPRMDLVISEALGAQAKVRSFFNNINDPDNPANDVTVDTHATSVVIGKRIAQESPEYDAMADGSAEGGEGFYHGTYPAAVEAYRAEAESRGIRPNRVQSQTWVVRKGLNDVIKGNPETSTIRNLLGDEKKRSKLPPEAIKYFEEELAVREAFESLLTQAREAGFEL